MEKTYCNTIMPDKKKILKNNLVDGTVNMLYCLTGKISFNRFIINDKFLPTEIEDNF
jgi:hypothetical protein